jgi:hypothetical protein
LEEISKLSNQEKNNFLFDFHSLRKKYIRTEENPNCAERKRFSREDYEKLFNIFRTPTDRTPTQSTLKKQQKNQLLGMAGNTIFTDDGTINLSKLTQREEKTLAQLTTNLLAKRNDANYQKYFSPEDQVFLTSHTDIQQKYNYLYNRMKKEREEVKSREERYKNTILDVQDMINDFLPKIL